MIYISGGWPYFSLSLPPRNSWLKVQSRDGRHDSWNHVVFQRNDLCIFMWWGRLFLAVSKFQCSHINELIHVLCIVDVILVSFRSHGCACVCVCVCSAWLVETYWNLKPSSPQGSFCSSQEPFRLSDLTRHVLVFLRSSLRPLRLSFKTDDILMTAKGHLPNCPFRVFGGLWNITTDLTIIDPEMKDHVISCRCEKPSALTPWLPPNGADKKGESWGCWDAWVSYAKFQDQWIECEMMWNAMNIRIEAWCSLGCEEVLIKGDFQLGSALPADLENFEQLVWTPKFPHQFHDVCF